MSVKKNLTPENLMALAVEEMKRSIDEPRKDDKVSPKVGAVLLKMDGTVETAHRGELRYGDHAEFTLIERKNRSEKLDGGILFATLEPCAPGARHHPKLSCAERIVNARISKVYVGIEDDDPKVARKGIEFLEEHGIKVEMFPRKLQEEIREANKEFIEGAIARADKERERPIELSTLEHSSPHARTDNFDYEATAKYRDKVEATSGYKIHDDTSHFLQIGIYTEDEDQAVTPSGFGMLLFGKQPRNTFHQAGLLAKVRYPNGEEENENFDEAMVLIPGKLEAWLKKVLALTSDRNHMERQDTPDVPMELIREAVVNALIHRDYSIEGAKCQLEIDSDQIVVKSPGEPIKPITLKQIQEFNAPMLSRNPLLHYVFSQMDLAEEKGHGLRSLKRRSQELGLPLPRYTYEAPYLNLTIFRTSEAAISDISPELLKLFSDDERRGWIWIQKQDDFSKAEYATALDLPDRTAVRHLKRFLDTGALKRKGAGPTTRYELLRF
ncbi:MAG: ATP-binding protein [Opitutaceae bacterium]